MTGPATPSLTPDEQARAQQVLLEAPVAFVAMVEHDELGDIPTTHASSARPYLVPMSFAYEPAQLPAGSPNPTAIDRRSGSRLGALYLHTGSGRKTVALAGNPRVCVAVTAQVSFFLGASPCEDGFAFRCVLLEGQALPVQDPSGREAALRAIVAKYDPAAADGTFSWSALAEALIYNVEVDSLTYKERPAHP